MTNNSFLKCKTCGAKFRIRYQIGRRDIKINFTCPDCGTSFYGILKIDNEHIKFDLKMNMMEEYEPSKDEEYYLVEVSSEFLTNKITKCDKEIIPTPFINSFSILGQDLDEESISQLFYLVDNKIVLSNMFITLSNFCKKENVANAVRFIKNANEPILKKYIKSFRADEIKNQLDLIMFSKQYLNSILIPLFPKDFSKVQESSMNWVYSVFSKNVSGFKAFESYLYKNGYFNSLFTNIPTYIYDYLNELEQIASCYVLIDKKDRIDYEHYGTTNIDLRNLTKLYSDGFELIGTLADPLIGLINVKDNGSYDNFGKGRESFINKINSFGNKSNKLNYLIARIKKDIPYFENKIDNVIRNSIAHATYSIDALTQKVTFISESKDKKYKQEMYLVEFAFKTIDIFNIILLLWEIIYQCKKFHIVLKNKSFVAESEYIREINKLNHK